MGEGGEFLGRLGGHLQVRWQEAAQAAVGVFDRALAKRDDCVISIGVAGDISNGDLHPDDV